MVAGGAPVVGAIRLITRVMTVLAADPGITQVFIMRGYQVLGMNLVVAIFTAHFLVYFVREMYRSHR
jgi:predicted acetyltransferase